MNNSEIEKKLWRKAKRYVRLLQIVPFLKMVSVCNNLAYGKVGTNSDIDLFIVTKKGRLFTTRLLVTFLLHILGVRRHGNKISGRFCLSFFVDEDGIDMSGISIDRDIYLAYWIKSMVPLIVDETFSVNELVKKNNWASQYFENKNEFFISEKSVLKFSWFKKNIKRMKEYFLGGRFGGFVESKLKKWQMKRAFRKTKFADGSASLIVSDHVLKFHNIDRREEYRDSWFRKYGKNAKLTKEKFFLL